MLRSLLRFPVCYSPEGDGAGGGAGAGDAGKVAADAVAAELAALRQEKVDRLAADKARGEDEAAKKGEHEKLATTLKAERDQLKAENERLAKSEKARLEKVEARNAERVALVPAGFRTLVPASLKGEDLADYLEANWKHLGGTEMAAGTIAAAKKVDDDKIPPECEVEAKRYGMAPALWFKNIWKPRAEAAKRKAAGAAS